MAFLSHDISMLRLFETFLENTPQLTLLLYVILRTNKAEPSQGEGARGCGLGGDRADGLSGSCRAPQEPLSLDSQSIPVPPKNPPNNPLTPP